ncbi:prolipoprotein diacylglyceryl transferase [Spiroplasma syrphidicola EA-1]|uniref:Phosphatidylglycerol--prolipoprotein diacylglyceryl transferase n=1 Tax=Spiroplasma syrphidicola EA-1 TaxID=1276229 RepID=R4U3E6_9MOLU|nr:prolipoprotein diacylglyceryl transferase [Spiroplasma syrphidicola]AGM25927.1 prolipoprotein diacylglyceryl transferase [Spiroplasma syrphidicola EA-1]
MLFNFLSSPLDPSTITPENTPHNILANYGWVHMYAVFMTLGMIAAILVSYFRLKRRRIPIEPLIWSVFLIIPASLFGASFFGKVNTFVDDPWISSRGAIPFFSLFAFWEAGMSIHGGVLFGAIVGLTIFGVVGRSSHVSLWVYADCIIPNILLGQIIGRWGNFFNHELLGNVTTYDALSWLPAFIRDNAWAWDGMHPETVINALGQAEIVYRQPIFLYESFFNFILWVVITFIVPNFGQWCSKKPWKKDPKQYPFDLKYSMQHFFHRKDDLTKMTWSQAWNKAYFKNYPNQAQLETIEPVSVKTGKCKIKNRLTHWWANGSQQLTKLNNPEGYTITRSGVQTGFYFLGWNIIRFILETQRENETELFIKNNRIADYTVLLLIAFAGLLIILFAQFVAPYHYRKNGFLYEKEYVDYQTLNNWHFKSYLEQNLILGEENYYNTLPAAIKKYAMQYLGYSPQQFDKYFTFENFLANENPKVEVVNFSFKIKAINNRENYFTDELVVVIDNKLDLTPIFNQKRIVVNQQNNKVSKAEIMAAMTAVLTEQSMKEKIETYWRKIYPHLNPAKTNVLTVPLEQLLSFEELNVVNNRLEISKFKVKETECYYAKKKITFKV